MACVHSDVHGVVSIEINRDLAYMYLDTIRILILHLKIH